MDNKKINDGEKQSVKQVKKPVSEDQKARLSKALRQNLQRRKAPEKNGK